ncbi:MAG: SHOCT domain-containing protein [Chloroflexi bacterium]|nr:SHOCT domain-containing protein [Chloroflexota bacterium]MBT7080039.1 SHOCT domain-containing protein [Chloroflexota bacterium]MBT7289887.1 SHOCT domain-containing protein [Chloroflexota bacterium]
MGGWNIFGGIMMFVFWGAIIALVVWGINRLSQNNSTSKTESRHNPIDIAKERYAKGEISKVEFEQIKSDLR